MKGARSEGSKRMDKRSIAVGIMCVGGDRKADAHEDARGLVALRPAKGCHGFVRHDNDCTRARGTEDGICTILS